MKIFSIHNGINSSAAYYANGKILEAVSEERFNKILDENRKQKEREATQGLLGLVPGSSKILERSERRIEQIKPKTYGGDDDL